MIDAPALTSCKWCKKSILMTTAVEHINGCLKIKKEKANRKKAAREARERAKEAALREERERRAEEEGITLGADGDSGDDDEDGEKVPGKTTKKVAGKKTGEGGPSGKKRKAEGEADKGPKQKKKKDEPKPKTKPKGKSTMHTDAVQHLPDIWTFSTDSTWPIHRPWHRLTESLVLETRRLRKAADGCILVQVRSMSSGNVV